MISSNKLLIPLAVFCMFASQGFSQKKLLTASTKIVRVGYLDAFRIRNEFTAFTIAKDKFAAEMKGYNKEYSAAINALNKLTQDKISKDSIAGGKQKEIIIRDSEKKRSELDLQYQEQLKLKNTERTAAFQQYERKISEATRQVVTDKGLTDVQLLPSDTSGKKLMTITDLILKKLN